MNKAIMISKGQRGMTARIGFKAALIAASIFALAGCISFGGGDPPPTLVSLTAASFAPAGSGVTGSLGAALVVSEPETDRRLAVQRIPVQIDDANIAYLKDAQWVERPARLMQSLLAETIRAKGGRLVVEDDHAEAGGGTRLAGRLLDMGYDARQRAVVVRYDAIREARGGAVATRRFETVIPNVEPTAAAVAPALNQAANQVAQQVADWVG
jgi:cholesterol transport system auxiliary component